SAIVIREYLVPISGDRFKNMDSLLVLKFGPTPLILVPVPISHQHIENTGTYIKRFIQKILLISPQSFKNPCGAFNIVIGFSKGLVIHPVLLRSFHDHIEFIAILLIIRPKGLLFRNIIYLRVGVIKPYGFG